ncbi:MAG: NAD(P)-dependent oxidoreductase [Hyphomicrobiales bacterium]|nr:NAD(P)-dependent oxidoreductase [Hyphomicrobiales bacterium]
MANLDLGFVGVGRMGGLMAPRLLDKGYKVTVFDKSAAAVEKLREFGASVAASAAEVADSADIVFLSLPTPDIVQSVATESLANGKRVKTVVDVSTTGPKVASAVARELEKHGVTYVDAPVSGGLKGAREGTLAVMVACPKSTFELIRPIMDILGRVFFVGEGAGQAQTLKLANNLLAAGVIAMTSETLAMGVKAGLDPKIMCDVINVSSGRNSATQDKFPKSVLPGTFDFGFATGLSYKDVRLCVDEAETLGVPMVVGAAVRQFLAVTQAKYGPDSDFTSMARVVEEWAHVEIRSAS